MPKLKAALGGFGGKHKDKHDSPAAVTCLLCYSDLYRSDHPGYFMIGDLGVAVGTSFAWAAFKIVLN